MNWLNYHHLYYFWQIAHLGSIANASKELNLTQSSLSSQLKNLENSLGFSLFNRIGRSLVLTDEGNYVLKVADKIFATGNALISEIENNQLGKKTAKIRIGAVSTLSKNIQQLFLTPFIGEKNYMRIWSSDEDVLLSKLAGYDLDFIITDNIDSKGFDSYQKYLIKKFPYCLVTQNSQGKSYRELILERGLIVPKIEGRIQVNLDLFLKRNEFDKNVIRGEIDDTALLRLMAVNEQAVVLIPRIGVYRDLLDQKIEVLKEVIDFEESFYLVTRPETFSLLHLDLFIAKFRELFNKEIE